MARESRRTRSSLIEDLERRPEAYDLFQAIRLAERIAAIQWRERGFEAPDPVGRGVDPKSAAVRLSSNLDLGFATAEVTRLRHHIGTPTEIAQSVVGLVGASGTMPAAFTEIVQASVRERNVGLRAFLDLFSNRLGGLLYDAFAKYRLTIETERRSLTGEATTDALMRSLIGIGSPALTNRLDAPDALVLHHAGLLGRHGRSAHAAERVLSSGLGQTIRIEQFVGEWLPIAAAERTRLAGGGRSQGSFARLGEDAVVGRRSWNIQGGVRLLVGPLTYPVFESYLPGGARQKRLASLAAFTLGPEMAFSQRLTLKAPEVPPLRLGGQKHEPGANRLGWNTWIGSAKPRTAPGIVDLPVRSALLPAAADAR